MAYSDRDRPVFRDSDVSLASRARRRGPESRSDIYDTRAVSCSNSGVPTAGKPDPTLSSEEGRRSNLFSGGCLGKKKERNSSKRLETSGELW